MKLIKTIPALPVVNIRDAAQFYITKLGFAVRHQEKDFCIVVRDGIEIHLWASCDHSWKYRWLVGRIKPIRTGAESFIAGTASCRIQVQGIDELYEEYKKKEVLHSPDTVVELMHWRDKEFPAVDLYRNLLMFYEPVE